MRKFLLLFLLLPSFMLSACNSDSIPTHYTAFSSVTELQSYLGWAPGKPRLISAHRGGPMPGYPENCLESFENILRYAPCLIECDVRETRDGRLVMMHDETVDRTTDGHGAVADLTLGELQALRLRDNDGNLTSYRIPTLEQTLEWARGKAILTLDVKGGLSPERIAGVIGEHHAEAWVVVITYTLETALRYHRLNPALILSVSAEGEESLRRLFQSEIPPANMVAFVGVVEPSPEFYAGLHAQGVRAILGTMGNLDRSAKARGLNVYVDLLRRGADILATDRVAEAAQALEQFAETAPRR